MDFEDLDISTVVIPDPDDVEIKSNIVPRSYQIEILNKALSGNVIAVLDTGSGKTLISALLIKRIHDIDVYEKRPKRITFFLVPKVPLVFQQQKYLGCNLNLNVKRYFGDMNVDAWNYEKWSSEIESTDVMVMTPDIFKSILDKSFVKMEKINLIVFDEAHHARKNHAYKAIIGLHYSRCLEIHRPKIFGMTASPLIAKENIEESIRILEHNLMSKAHTFETSNHVSHPREYCKFFQAPPVYEPPAFYSKLVNNCANNFPILKTALKQSLVICDELGPWCSERALELSVHDVFTKFRYNAYSLVDSEITEQNEIENILCKLEGLILDTPDLLDRIIPPKKNDFSPKVLALISILEKFKPLGKNFCGIVFCKQRSTASVLSMAIKYCPQLKWIRPGVIVGHGSGKNSNAIMTVKGQSDIMDDFRANRVNLLFATQVAEEGLDIQSCILVIRFDMFSNLASYIQSRGRARHKSSLFVVLSQKEDPLEASVLACMQLEEEKMRKKLYEEKTEDLDDFIDNYEIDESEIFQIESTGACVSISSSLQLLHHYCSTRPSDNSVQLKPDFQEQSMISSDPKDPDIAVKFFFYKLTLPMNVPQACREVIGKPSRTKKHAKKLAAFDCIQKLYFSGELDNRLCPIRPMKEIPVAKSKLAKNIQIFECIYREPMLFGKSWHKITKGYLHKIFITHQGQTRRLLQTGILTCASENIPNLSFSFLMQDEETHIEVEPIPGIVNITEERLKMIRHFHFNLMTSILRSSFTKNDDFTMMTLPLKSTFEVADSAINWNLLQDLFHETSRNLMDLMESGEFSKRDLSNLVLYDHVHYKRRYFIKDILPQSNPYSTDKVFQGMGKHPNPASYYKNRLKYSGEIFESQQIICGEPITVPYLTVKAIYHDRFETCLIPQFCTIHPIPANIMEYEAPRLPLILYHLHHNLLVLENIKGWKLNHFDSCLRDNNVIRTELPVSLKTLRPALTASCAELGFDYERLETLGDSFLKLHLSLHFFALHPTRHEGWLTISRHSVERNTFLYAKAIEHNVDQCILFHKMKRTQWIPAMNSSHKKMQYLPDKTIADAIEAIIGACVVDSHELGGAVAINRYLGAEYKSDLKAYSEVWDKYFKLQDDPRKRVFINRMERTISLVETTIGYTFKDKRYVVEAITHPSSLGPGVDGIGNCYQRLEFLGDAVLGYLITVYLYKHNPPLDPHLLSEFRSALVNNQFLAVVACSLELHMHLEHLSIPLAKSLLAFTEELEQKIEIIESDLKWLPRKRIKTRHIGNFNSLTYKSASYQKILQVSSDSASITETVENGYSSEISLNTEYNIPVNVHDSGTPSKSKSKEKRPKPQNINEILDKIEILGNAELELMEDMAETICDINTIQKHESIAISNYIENLSAETYKARSSTVDVELEISTVDVEDDLGAGKIINIKESVEKRSPSESTLNDAGPEAHDTDSKLDHHGLKPLFWDDMVTAPKAAGDIYESLLGAVYLDSGLDIGEVWKVIDSTLIQRWWSRFELSKTLNDGTIENNSIKVYLEIIGKDFMCQKSSISVSKVNSTEEIYRSDVFFHESIIGTATGGCSKFAKKSSCRMAIEFLKENRAKLRRDCRCRRVVIHSNSEPPENSQKNVSEPELSANTNTASVNVQETRPVSNQNESTQKKAPQIIYHDEIL